MLRTRLAFLLVLRFILLEYQPSLLLALLMIVKRCYHLLLKELHVLDLFQIPLLSHYRSLRFQPLPLAKLLAFLLTVVHLQP